VGQVWFDLLLAPLEKGDLFMERKIEYVFTPVPRIVMKKLFKSNLTIYENRVLRFVFHKLYDWGHKEDTIGIDQIARATGISKRNVSKTLLSLKLRHIITREGCITGITEDIIGWNVTSTEKYILSTSTEKEKYFPVDAKVTSTGKTTKETPKEIKKERVFSKPPGGKKEREVPEGLKTLMKDIGNMPGIKK